VDLLRCYSNLALEVGPALQGLSELPRSAVVGDDVASPPRVLRERLPRSIISEMILEYQAGASTRDLAAKYDRSKTAVLNILKAQGVVRPRERITEQQIKKASRLIHRGHTINRAAAQLGVASSTLR
jgi:AraC-like DNA-binding protein